MVGCSECCEVFVSDSFSCQIISPYGEPVASMEVGQGRSSWTTLTVWEVKTPCLSVFMTLYFGTTVQPTTVKMLQWSVEVCKLSRAVACRGVMGSRGEWLHNSWLECGRLRVSVCTCFFFPSIVSEWLCEVG